MTISPNKWELDVQGYLNTCNITAATPRQQIRDFAKGVNDLGLWSSMVCWPLRSSQNYGTGTTAFSLGGLGTFNGTLVNGAVMSASGVAFDGVNDYMQAPLGGLAATDYSYFGIMRVENTDFAVHTGIGNTAVDFIDGFEAYNDGSTSAALFTNTVTNRVNIAVTPTVPTTHFVPQFAAYTATGGLFSNISTTTTASFTKFGTAPNSIMLAARQNFGAASLFKAMTQPWAAMFAGDRSANRDALYTLYKDTLGQGLTILP
jgi:hypothetical protein